MLRRLALVLGCALCAARGRVTAATPPSGFDEFDRKIHAELTAVSPDAERIFREADEARAREDHARAVELYAKVFELAPRFVHALRRQAGEELALGQRGTAISHLQVALGMDRSAPNLAMLALALVRKGESEPTPYDVERARGLAQEAVALEPEDEYAQSVRGEVALASSDLAGLDASVDALSRIAPDSVGTNYFRAIAAASHGDFDGADAALERARTAGLPEEAYRSLKASFSSSRPSGPRLARWGAIVAGIWIGLGLVLLVAGFGLSAVTLRKAEEVPADPNAGATGGEAFLRRIYRYVLWVCCAYYFVSLPLLFVLVLAVGGGLVYGMLVVGHIPVKLLVIVAVITAVTAWSILKSVVVRAKESDPGERLDFAREPALRRELEDVAAKIGTRPVDTVFLTPGTDVAVFERGGSLRQLSGKAERCLILGAGALEGMQLGPFRAVLAHEYGHFSNRDTAGGGFALSVRRSVFALASNLGRSGAATWYNPAWLFVNGFHRVFLRISQGASRLQEVLADRWAAISYGAQSFEDGLRHVIRRSIQFNAHVNATLSEVVESNRPLPNLYRYEPAPAKDAPDVDAELCRAIEREPSPYDSHPRPCDRFRWVHALGVAGVQSADDGAPVWSLFSDRAAIEERMTGVVRDSLNASHGIRLRAAD